MSSDLVTFFNTHKPKSSPGTAQLALEHTESAPGTVAIDLCCGSGWLAAQAAQRGFRSVGIDISSRYIGVEAEGLARFIVGDMSSLPVEDECAQVIYCIDSLQYAPDPERTLREMARLLRPGGQLIFSTQNTTNPAGLKKRIMERLTGRNWSPWLAHPVESPIPYAWLMQALARQGFEVEYVRGRQMLIAWVSLLPGFIRYWSPWRGKSWRSLQSLAQRAPIPAFVEESFLGRFGMIVFVQARKK